MVERESTSEHPAGGVRASWSLLRRNRDFRHVYLASMISLGGDWFLLVALFGLVLDLTDNSPIAVAFLLAVQDVPLFLLSPAAGALVDRLDRRKLMVVCDLARAVICFGFLFVRSSETVWIAYPLLAVMSSFAAGFDPASSAALPNLVDDRDLATANALTGSLWGTMLTVGAALGGIVAAVAGRDTAIVVDALSFGASGLLIASVHRPFSEDRGHEQEHPKIVEATRETLSYAAKDHRVLALLAVKFGFGFGAGVLVLISVFATDVFRGGDVAIGLLMAARGVGALVGPFVGRALLGTADRRLFAVIGGALLVFGLGYTLLGFAPALAVAMPIVAIAHLGGGAQWMLSSYGLQRIVPDRLRGRIFAFDLALITLTFAISSVVTGWTAELFGARRVAIALGVIGTAYAIVWTWLTTDVRRATMLEGCGAPPESEYEAARVAAD
ncbi:MAG TPA: MFS transporter [Actinomycetota bacterium]|nr:MFS transporter [Actinomycetota bacterium]